MACAIVLESTHGVLKVSTSYIDGRRTVSKLMEIFGSLSKRLRAIKDVHLELGSVQPISPGNITLHS